MQLNLSPSVRDAGLLKQAPMTLAFAGGDVRPWQRKLRTKLLGLLGYQGNDHARISAKRVWSRPVEHGTIEKLILRVEPKVDVPVYWCVPHRRIEPHITAICLQGHSTGMHVSIAVDREDETKPYAAQGDRDFAIGCIRRGIAALCIEQRSMGTRRELVQEAVCGHSTCHDAAFRAILIGQTLIGHRVFDVDRALDYLQQRGDVDMKHVGIMGNSGGGTVTTYASALLPRLAFAIPSCAIAGYAESIGSIYHCGCNYIPGIMNWMDMGDVLGAFAPKPLVVVSGLKDDIFPIASAKKQFAKTRAAYAAGGAAGNCKHLIGPEGHRFYADLAWGAMLPMLGVKP